MTKSRIAQLDPSNPDVAKEIHGVMMSAYRIEAKLLGVSNFPPLRRSKADVAAADSVFIGTFSEGLLAAVAEIEETAENDITITALVVHPSQFRRGFGTALVQNIVDRHQGMRIAVHTGARNAPARALYDRMGFEVACSWVTDDGVEMVELFCET